jgi:hypothetical protein
MKTRPPLSIRIAAGGLIALMISSPAALHCEQRTEDYEGAFQGTNCSVKITWDNYGGQGSVNGQLMAKNGKCWYFSGQCPDSGNLTLYIENKEYRLIRHSSGGKTSWLGPSFSFTKTDGGGGYQPPTKGGGYAPPSTGAYSPPTPPAYTPPTGSTYTPPTPPAYTPPTPPAYTPPAPPAYTPPAPPAYTPPTPPAYTPPTPPAYTPPTPPAYTPPAPPAYNPPTGSTYTPPTPPAYTPPAPPASPAYTPPTGSTYTPPAAPPTYTPPAPPAYTPPTGSTYKPPTPPTYSPPTTPPAYTPPTGSTYTPPNTTPSYTPPTSGAYRGVAAPTEGAVWVIACESADSQSSADQAAATWQSRGFLSGAIWIPDYTSLGSEKQWLVYVGRYNYADKKEAEASLAQVKQHYPAAYGIKVDQSGQRETF